VSLENGFLGCFELKEGVPGNWDALFARGPKGLGMAGPLRGVGDHGKHLNAGYGSHGSVQANVLGYF